MSSLKSHSKRVTNEIKIVSKLTFTKHDGLKRSLLLFSDALIDCVNTIEDKNSNRPGYYNATCINIMEEVMDDMLDIMSDFKMIEDKYNDSIHKNTVKSHISTIENTVETAHERMNSVVLYYDEDSDKDAYKEEIKECKNVIKEIKSLTKSPSPSPVRKSPSPVNKTVKRCPRGSRRNKKTGNCDPVNKSSAKNVTMKRCPRGSRRNKKTGNCDPVK